jgi:hypothetical protein
MHEIGCYRCPGCKSILRLGTAPHLATGASKEMLRMQWQRFKPVRLVPQPGLKIYPARCKKCGGKGRVKRAVNRGGVLAP